MVDMEVRILSLIFKRRAGWAADKWLWVISTIMLFKKLVLRSYKQLKYKAVLNLKQYCLHCYVALSNVF